MHRFHSGRTVATRRAFAVATAVLCLALLALLSVVQVAHIHTTASDADHCQLCIMLHGGVAPTATAAAAIVPVQIWSLAPTAESRVAIRYWHPTLFTRPPPTAC